jgi:hypothetical protein
MDLVAAKMPRKSLPDVLKMAVQTYEEVIA